MNNSAFCKVFTPGRLCLLGEHTDWVALISKDNYGHAIICNLNFISLVGSQFIQIQIT